MQRAALAALCCVACNPVFGVDELRYSNVGSAGGTANSGGKLMGLDIRAGGAKPGAVLGAGSWTSTKAAGWQGCNFDRAIALQAKTQYWLVWQDPGSSTLPVAKSGTSHATLGGIGALLVCRGLAREAREAP